MRKSKDSQEQVINLVILNCGSCDWFGKRKECESKISLRDGRYHIEYYCPLCKKVCQIPQ